MSNVYSDYDIAYSTKSYLFKNTYILGLWRLIKNRLILHCLNYFMPNLKYNLCLPLFSACTLCTSKYLKALVHLHPVMS